MSKPGGYSDNPKERYDQVKRDLGEILNTLRDWEARLPAMIRRAEGLAELVDSGTQREETEDGDDEEAGGERAGDGAGDG